MKNTELITQLKRILDDANRNISETKPNDIGQRYAFAVGAMQSGISNLIIRLEVEDECDKKIAARRYI